MKLHELQHAQDLYKNGLYYHYPQCCIIYFIKTFSQADRNRRPRPSHRGTGYIPCPKCVNKPFPRDRNLNG